MNIPVQYFHVDLRRKGKGTGSDGTAKQSCRKEGGGGKRRREHEERGVNGGDEEEEVRQVGKPGSAKGLCTGRGRGQLDLPLRPPLPPPP